MDLISGINTSGLYARYADSALKDSDGNIITATYLTAHQNISATEWNETYDTVTANSAQWSESTEYSAGRGIEIDDDVIQIADSAYSAISGTPWSFIDGPNTRVIADSDNNTLAISAGAGGGGESKEVSAGQGISIEETTDNIVIGITNSAYSAISGTPWTFVDGTNTKVVTNTANNTISISAGAGGSTGEYLPLSGGDLSGDVTLNDATIHINDYQDGTRVNNVADIFAYNSAAWIKARTSGGVNENMAAIGVTLSGGVPLVELQIGPNGVNGWNSWEIRNIYPIVVHSRGTTASQSWANDNTLHIILEE